jgi:hypothetical protein
MTLCEVDLGAENRLFPWCPSKTTTLQYESSNNNKRVTPVKMLILLEIVIDLIGCTDDS